MNDWRLVKSMRYAVRGLITVFRTELSFRLQTLAALVVIVLMYVFPLSQWQRVILFMLIGFVLTLEVVNTIFERLVDAFKPRVHPVVAEIKDMMAAAVLISSVLSLIVGVIIFWPYV